MTGQHRSEFPAHIADSPFQRLAALIAGETPGAKPIDLAVGNPRHPIPPFVADTIAANVNGYGDYPTIRGTAAFRASVADWLDGRFTLAGLIAPETGVLPLNGSREGLYFATIGADAYLKKPGDRPVVLVPTPGYPAYSVGAFAVGAEIVPYGAASPHGVMPDWDALGPSLLDRAIAVFVASPSNPQGAVASAEYWADLIDLAEKYDFRIFADECYSEIYRGDPPVGGLEICAKLGGDLSNVLVLHSLSKRSSAPGIRVGTVAGDPKLIDAYRTIRSYAGVAVPMPLLKAGEALLRDEDHVDRNRAHYADLIGMAERHLGNTPGYSNPPRGFYL
mgnify:CR=1 FL=1